MRQFEGDKKVIALFLFPAFALIFIFLLYPLLRTFYNSFFYILQNTNPRFVGIKNYIKLISDPGMLKAIKNTLLLMVAAVVIEVGLGTVMAILVNFIKKGKRFFRVVYVFPVVVSAAALGLLFSLIYNYRIGLLNSIISWLGYSPIRWITTKTSLAAVIAPVTWRYVGFYFIIILTAITKIPKTLYESARIQGASRWQQTVHITLPLIFSDIRISIIIAITGVTKVFSMIWIITQGGPLDSSQVLGTYLYSVTFERRLFGYGSTIAVFIVIFGLILVLITNKLLKRDDGIGYGSPGI